jgi:hypothetical protein
MPAFIYVKETLSSFVTLICVSFLNFLKLPVLVASRTLAISFYFLLNLAIGSSTRRISVHVFFLPIKLGYLNIIISLFVDYHRFSLHYLPGRVR